MCRKQCCGDRFGAVTTVCSAPSPRSLIGFSSAMFNGGSLISYRRIATSKVIPISCSSTSPLTFSLFSQTKLGSYAVREDVVEALRLYTERVGFHLGFYSQEFDLDQHGVPLSLSFRRQRSRSGLRFLDAPPLLFVLLSLCKETV